MKIYHQLDGTVVRKANCDVDLTFYVMRELDEFSKAIFFTGDGDFLPLIEYLRISRGLKVEVMSFGRSTSGKLREFADDFIDLGDDPNRYLLKGHPPKAKK